MKGANKKGFFPAGEAHRQRKEAIIEGTYSVIGDVFREIFIGPDHAELRKLNADNFTDDPAKQRRIRAAQKDFSFSLNTIGRIGSYFFGHNDADPTPTSGLGWAGRIIWRMGCTVVNAVILATVFPLGLIDRGCQKLDVKLMQASKSLWKSDHGFFSFLVGTVALIPRAVSKGTKILFLGTSAAIDWNNSYKRAEMRDKEMETGVFWRAASVVTSFMSWVVTSVFTGGVTAIPGAVGALGVAGSVIPGAANVVSAIPTATTISIPSMTIPGAATNAVNLGHLATPAAEISSSSIILGALPPAVGGACHGVKKLTTPKEKPPVAENPMNQINLGSPSPPPSATNSFNPTSPHLNPVSEDSENYTRSSSI